MSTQEEIRAKYEFLKPHLKGRQHRLWAASEAIALGRGGIKLIAAATGISRARISSGVQELRGRATRPRVPSARQRGGQFWEDRDPTLLPDLEELLADEIAGDPMTEQTWVRISIRKVQNLLRAKGHDVGHCTVHRLLKKLGLSLRANKKRRSGSQSPGRDEQFRYIASQRKAFVGAGLPVISIDTKKKELIGNFRNPGKVWCRSAAEVNEYDFTSTAECRAVPFGVYDVARNRGYMVVGLSNETPDFAVSAIAGWWRDEGRAAYPGASALLILADCGSTNGYRCAAWKLNLQETLCDRQGLTVTVCHYPPGCSKWNPVERRLFSQISVNWAGKPLRSLGIMLGYIRGTTTKTGLTVTARLDETTYKKSQKVSREQIDGLRLTRHGVCPDWNYTLRLRTKGAG
jgi:hypothetical protein